MPIKNLTERRRMPRIGKIHLGIKVTNAKGITYPQATDYFVWPEPDAPGGEVLGQLIETYGEKPKELKIIFPLNDEESIASQYYRCYTRSRGLVCRGDGEVCMRMLDIKTGALPTTDTKDTELKEMSCAGKECPDYQSGMCREVMNLQFMLPTISGMGVWQIDTSSINSIRNINSCLEVIKAVYRRLDMVPLTLSLEPKQVTPPSGMKKTVRVLNIRSQDSMIDALIKAQKPPLELIIGKADLEQAERDIAELWPNDEQDRMLSGEEAAGRMTQAEITAANRPTGEGDDNSPRWTAFWTQAKALLGTVAEEKGVELTALVHQMLGVKSMKDWPKTGKSLDDAIRALSDTLAKGDGGKQGSSEVTSRIKPWAEWDKIGKEEVPTYPKLETVFHTLTDKQPKEMYVELGVGSRNDMTISAWDAFITLRERFAPEK